MRQRVLSLLAAGFCFMAGAAGYHQIILSEIHYPVTEPKPAIYVSVNNTDLDTIDELTLQVPDDIKVICAKYGAEYGIDPELLEAIAWRESRFVANMVSENGSCKGVMQVNDQIHKERIEKLAVKDIYDIDENIHVAADYLAELLKDNPSIEYALARYHGESRPEKVLNGAKPSNYVRQIIRVRDALKSLRKEA